MTITPIVQVVTVPVPPDRAFVLFTSAMGKWWSPTMHIAPEPFADIVIEPFSGGRWYERDAAGAECQWGTVLSWEPPSRLLLGWQLNGSFGFDPDLVTEVEVSFQPEGSGTRVTLTHRNLERFGPSAVRIAGQLAEGWPGLVQRFATFARKETR